MTPEAASLMQKAARCYLAANSPDAACRCLEALGDFAGAARLHESQGRWAQAAAGHEAAGDWAAAARCHLSAGQPAAAAEAYLRAGEALEAAWVLADLVGRYDRARAEAGRVPRDTEVRRHGAELVLARCDAGAGAERAAALRVRAFTEGLGQMAVMVAMRLMPWALAVTAALRRPDLTAELYAAAVAARMPGAEREWERWALRELGDATGVPAPPEAAPPPEE